MAVFSVNTRQKSPGPLFLCPIEAELKLVEEVISNELISEVQTVETVSRHVLDAGGKRLRPSLVILSAGAVLNGHDPIRLTNVAAGAELIHTATLMHDDVIDDSNSRRGRATANTLWGNRVSVLSGDYVLAKAFSLLSRDGDMAIMRALSDATIAMAEGEVAQIEAKGDTHALTNAYLTIIRQKTAEFMSACCRIGAILGSGSAYETEALAAYALDLGMAFQITDDLLDLVGDPAQTGKPVGGDLREGKVTMPIIITLQRVTPSDRDAVEAIIRSEDASPNDVEFVRGLAESTGAVEATRESAADYISKAICSLNALPPSDARDSLEQLAGYILNRGS